MNNSEERWAGSKTVAFWFLYNSVSPGRAGTEPPGTAWGRLQSTASILLFLFSVPSLLPDFCALLPSPLYLGVSGASLLLHCAPPPPPPGPPIHLVRSQLCDVVVLPAPNQSSGVAGGGKPSDPPKRTFRANRSPFRKVSAGSCLQLCQTKCAAKCQLSLCAVTPRAAKRY